MRNRYLLITILLLSVLFPAVIAQKQINSPYARFNIGVLEPQGSFKSRAMGGTGTALRDNRSLFYMNPASYSSIDTNSFVFDFGMDFGMSTLTQGDALYNSNDMTFNHLVMGFPIAKGWSIATGIVPVSYGYYNISQDIKEGDADYTAVTGPYSLFYKGKGGLSNAFLGTGANITKNFSVGVNMALLFGILERNFTLRFDDLDNYFHNSTSEKMQVRGINLEYGMQYRTKIKDKYFLVAGLSMASEKRYKSDYYYIAVKTSAYNAVDTISLISDKAAPILIPATYRAGISFGKTDKYTTTFDFSATNWGKSDIPGYSGYAAKTKSFMWGLEIVPDRYSNFSYLKRVEYRLGAHAGDNYLVINNSQIKEAGVSIGLGLPLRKNSLSRANIFADLTQKKGSEASGMHNERIITIGASINFYDFWFIQRKYD